MFGFGIHFVAIVFEEVLGIGLVTAGIVGIPVSLLPP